MIDLKKIPEIIQAKTQTSKEDFPKHIIINTVTKVNDPNQKKEIDTKKLSVVLDIIKSQVELNIPIITISLGTQNDILDEDLLYEFLDVELKKYVNQNKMRTSFIGKWYSLTGMTVEAIKRIVDSTKDYDNFFLNFCVNYDGQEEIADACKVILMKSFDNKLDPYSISKDMIKENIYSSYFIPADLIIELTNNFSATFLWDSKNARIFFANKNFEDFTKADLMKGIEYYKRP